MDDIELKFWIFPEDDFAAWRELVGTPQVATFAEYLTLVAAMQADQEHSGHAVRRVYFTVAEMIDGLAARNLTNTPDHRALVIAARN